VVSVVLTRAAASDIREANRWYQEKGGSALAALFREAIDRAITRVEREPLQFPVVHRTVRRAVLVRFPYLLFFTVTDERPTIIACLHASRNPVIWKRRTPPTGG
jgi:plasmid stabilization system protein ParE